MTLVRRWQGAALVGVVAAGVLVGAAASGVAGLDPRCPRRPTASPVVAVVDSGLSGLPATRVVGPRIDLTDERSTDLDPHGTQVAGIILDQSPEARLLDVRVLDEAGRARASTLAAGVERAVEAGADLINVSAEVPAGDPGVQDALRRADREGAVVVLAAGNERRDLDDDPAWIRVSALRCVAVVAAADSDGALLARSNHGRRVVDLVSPGAEVATSRPDGSSTTAGSTSVAAAVVTGGLASP